MACDILLYTHNGSKSWAHYAYVWEPLTCVALFMNYMYIMYKSVGVGVWVGMWVCVMIYDMTYCFFSCVRF